jgi:hypothetical protein
MTEPAAPPPGSPPDAMPAASPSFDIPEGMIYVGANSVARWFIELGFTEGKPCLLAKQVFVDAPKTESAITRQLAAGRIFFSLKQLEMLMNIRHHIEVTMPDYERVRIAAHLGSR